MVTKFRVDEKKSDTVSKQLGRLLRMMQSQDVHEAIIMQDIAALRRTLPDEKDAVISNVTVTIETR